MAPFRPPVLGFASINTAHSDSLYRTGILSGGMHLYYIHISALRRLFCEVGFRDNGSNWGRVAVSRSFDLYGSELDSGPFAGWRLCVEGVTAHAPRFTVHVSCFKVSGPRRGSSRCGRWRANSRVRTRLFLEKKTKVVPDSSCDNTKYQIHSR